MSRSTLARHTTRRIRKILLTGKNGQVGWELQRTLAPLGEVVAVDRERMDLSKPDSVRSVIREIKPDLIINPAAYTAVDKAESEPELAMAVNGTAPGIMAEEAKRLGASLIHFSTDYVFDGTKETHYTEEDTPNPLNVYGATKLAGELAILSSGIPHLILRTSWVYGMRGKNFLLTMLRLAQERGELKVVSDQIGAPTWSRMIAEASAQIIAQGSDDLENVSGIFNLTAGGRTSWCAFAQKIMENAQLATRVTAIPTTDYPLPAQRPMFSLLSNEKLFQTFRINLPSWDNALTLCMSQ